MERDYFAQKKIEYTEILVDENPQEVSKMVEISGQMGVPFTVIDSGGGQRVAILGFDKKKIDETLGMS